MPALSQPDQPVPAIAPSGVAGVVGAGTAAAGRLQWLDVAKGWAIVLVALGHNEALVMASPLLHQVVFSFHVPLFFVVSGMTLGRLGLAGAIVERSLGLLWVYLVWALLISLRALASPAGGPGLGDVLGGVAYATGATIRAVPLWFLPCLALVLPAAALVTSVCRRLGGRWWPAAALVAAALALAGGVTCLLAATEPMRHALRWGSPASAGWPWSLDLALLGVGYAVLGAALVQPIAKLRPDRMGLLALPLALAFLIVSVVELPRVDLNLRQLSPVPGALAASVLGAGLVVVLARWLVALGGGALAGRLGRASLPILVLHNPIQHAVGDGLAALAGRPGVVTGLLALLAGLLVPWWLNRQLFMRTRWGRFLFYPRAWLRARARAPASPALPGAS